MDFFDLSDREKARLTHCSASLLGSSAGLAKTRFLAARNVVLSV
jgi:hypothetical protein